MNFADLINFISPLTFFQSPAGIIDIILLVGIPAVLLKNFWRGLVFFVGFCISQVTFAYDPWVEMMFEIAGMVVMILSCTYKVGGVNDEKRKNDNPFVDEGFKRSKKKSIS